MVLLLVAKKGREKMIIQRCFWFQNCWKVTLFYIILHFELTAYFFSPPPPPPNLNAWISKVKLFNFRITIVQYCWLCCDRLPNWTATLPQAQPCRRFPSGWTWNELCFVSKRSEKVQRLCWPWRSSNTGNVFMQQSALILTQVWNCLFFLLFKNLFTQVSKLEGRSVVDHQPKIFFVQNKFPGVILLLNFPTMEYCGCRN